MDEYTTYITSDLHFYHKNMIRYSDRPYPETEEGLIQMNDDIIKAFDALPEGSTIINLGDICLNSDVTYQDLQLLVGRMKANNKHLWIILGNHDRDIMKYIKGHDYDNPIDFFTNLGYERVEEFPILFRYNNLLLSHEPVYLKPGTNLINVHGHTHQFPIDKDYFNRACENWAMMEVVKREMVSKQKNLDIDTSILPLGKEVNTDDYINVCWDYKHEILHLRDVIREEVLRRK